LLVAWEAWALAARSRGEAAVRGRISSVKNKLKKAGKRLKRYIGLLEEEMEKASSLMVEAEEIKDVQHKAVKEATNIRFSLEEVIGNSAAWLEKAISILQALEKRQMRLDFLLREAQREAAVGSLDRAHELVIEAERLGEDVLEELSHILDKLEEERRALKKLGKRLRDLLELIEHEAGLVARAGVALEEGEAICLARLCRAMGLGVGALIITDERIIFSPRTGDESLEIRREGLEEVSTSRAFLGLRKKLLLTFLRDGERGELILWCNKRDAKDILAELSAQAKGGHEAQAGGLHPGR